MLRTVYLLQLTVWILCMQLVRTVYLLQITASGAARSNETEVGATNQIPSFEEIENVHKNSRAIVRPSSIGLRLQKTPSPLKPASISEVGKSESKAMSLLHSAAAQIPSTTTSTQVAVSTDAPSGSTNGFVAMTSSAPPNIPTAAPASGVTQAATGTSPAVPVLPTGIPTQQPVARWAQGGLLTMHGCECAESWQLNGLTLRGCVVSSNVRMPWCIVKDPANCKKGYTNSALPISPTVTQSPNPIPITINGTWDFCTLPDDVDPHLTLGSCHCLPLWEHEGVAYSGCNQTNRGQSWCYVAETAEKCVGARQPDATHFQLWDKCDSPAREPSFMTKNSCHCKPRWTHLGKEYTTCVQDELVQPPAVLNTTNTSIKKELLGWCQVFEDERLCPNVELSETGVLWDTCFFLDEASYAELPPSLHGCHCLPEWSLDGAVYKGCAYTPRAKAPWCPVVEDERTCSNSLGPSDSEFGAGRGRRRWDWCSIANPKDPSQPWRSASERFTPKDPSPPSWYQNVFNDLMDDHADWLNDRRMKQASYNGRRRIR